MEIAVVGATAVVTRRRRHGDRRPGRDHGARADDPARARGRGCADGSDGGDAAHRGGGCRGRGRRDPIADVRGSADYRRAMAAVIARRAIEAALARRAAGGRTREGRGDADRERHRLPGRARSRHEPARRRARRGRPDRLEGGLRRLRVRGLHDAARRTAGELVLLPRPAGRGQRDHDGRGARRRRHAARCRPRSSTGGVQCGFCTPGMLISATALLASNPSPTEDEVRIGLSGNLCRCTGYDGIVKAVLSVARA